MLNEPWNEGLTETDLRRLGVLWGKSDAAGSMNLLIQHLFDTAAVAELMWDHFLAGNIRNRLDVIAGERGGRALFAWLCGIHDVGKATPAFQSLQPELCTAVAETGLPFRIRKGRQSWRHDRAGASHLDSHRMNILGPEASEQMDWLWPLVGGHHGRFPDLADIGVKGKSDRRSKQGTGEEWSRIRTILMQCVALATGHHSLTETAPSLTPTKGEQLALSGFMVMADWISSSSHLVGVTDIGSVGMDNARRRATIAWDALGIQGGWRRLTKPPDNPIHERFGNHPRAVQGLALELTRDMTTPGLMIVEAPMGEGKTHLALASAEILAERFGCNGVAFAMPTQATCDPIFEQVGSWLGQLGRDLPIALLHGRRLVDPGWTDLVRRAVRPTTDGGDQYGMDDPYLSFAEIVDATCEDCDTHIGDGRNESPHGRSGGLQPAAQWFLGRYRGLLSPNFVATIDQLLFAATRTKFVGLRFSGLAGKVVIIDEVHAADVYMIEFLDELLTWLGSAGVPVILLSATLAERQRELLANAYASGVAGRNGILPARRRGYPQITLVEPAPDGTRAVPRISTHTCAPTSHEKKVRVETIHGVDEHANEATVAAVVDAVADGGVALVIRNTVSRSRTIFERLRAELESDVVLLHSRFTAEDRAKSAEHVMRVLGPPPAPRPQRLVVVATQVAEQSFDVDADILFTDLAPIDLLLQRTGRMHRHDRARPPRLVQPTVVVTAMPTIEENGQVVTEYGAAHIYGNHHLLRAATLIESASATGWSVPTDIPRLIDLAYGDNPPILLEWAATCADSALVAEQEEAKRKTIATSYLLGRKGFGSTPTLAGLHEMANTRSGDVEQHVRVRDGDHESLEAILLQRDEKGFHTVTGRPLGHVGEIARENPALAVAGLIRVPPMHSSSGSLHQLIIDRSVPPGDWHEHPWLGHVPVITLDSRNSAILGPFIISYDNTLGLQVEVTRS